MPSAVRSTSGTWIVARSAVDSSRLACSQANSRRCHSTACRRRSTLCRRQNWLAAASARTWSRSSPPSQVSPAVVNTWNTERDTSTSEKSKVPPPKSYTPMMPPKPGT